jgi:hypothetical protein
MGDKARKGTWRASMASREARVRRAPTRLSVKGSRAVAGLCGREGEPYL